MAFEWLDFQPVTDTISGAFGWLKDNPEIAAGIAGAAGAGVKYLESREAIKEQRRQRAEDREYRASFGGASSLDSGAYGQGLNIASPQTGIATSIGTGTPQVGVVGQQPSMANALELRAQREQGALYGR